MNETNIALLLTSLLPISLETIGLLCIVSGFIGIFRSFKIEGRKAISLIFVGIILLDSAFLFVWHLASESISSTFNTISSPTPEFTPTPPTFQLTCIAIPNTGLEQGTYQINGSIHVVELWRANKDSPWGSTLVTAVVYGNFSIMQAGGSVWTYTGGCEAIAINNRNNAAERTGAKIVTDTELRSAGIIQ